MARSRVELFGQIRRDRRAGGLSIRELADRHRVHRRTVRQALASAVPPSRRAYPRRPRPAVDRYAQVIDGCLLADREVPRKQRHTARRIRDNLTARIAEAEREGWLGEIEGLQVSLAGAEDKLAQIDRRPRNGAPVDLGLPALRNKTPR